MKKQTLALCIISSADDLEKSNKLAESLSPFVDEIVITGPDEFKWSDDFSAARTFNFSQAKSDWILWLDADDTLTNPENLRKLIDSAEQNRLSGYWFPYQYAFDENGNCVMEHWKIQLLKNDSHFEWRGRIHEDPIMLRSTRWAKTRECIRVHHTTKEHSIESEKRNVRILEESLVENPNEPRTLFYLGRTYITLGEFDKGVAMLDKYLDLSGWDQERYEAALLIGQVYIANGDFDKALITYNAAILEREGMPDAYISKGICYLNKQEYNDALYNFKIALSFGIPESDTYVNPMLYTRDLYSAVAIAYMHLGKLPEALTAITIALKYDIKNKDLSETRTFIINEKKKYDIAMKYVDIAKYLDKPEKITELLATVPPALQDNEMVLAVKNTFSPPKTWPKKSIAIYCGSSAENWGPDSLAKGIGGSETAIIELTKRLSKMGWSVTVFNQCNAQPEGFTHEGVHWKNYWTFNPKDTFDVLWVWRIPELFDFELTANLRILDLHDTMSPLDFTEDRLKQMDRIFVKTEFHRSLYPNIPDDKFVIINNGIDLSRFEGSKEKEPLRFCYTSSPTRGLDVLLTMWPKVREKLPTAELHVYYGWKTYYEVEKHNPERIAWMKKVQALMDQEGVIDHGRVGQDELAKDLLKTSFWLYPTDFPEISCITCMEIQAANVLPITSGYAALAETQVAGLQLKGDIHDPKWQDEFIRQIIEQASIPQPDISNLAQQFSWNKVADAWNINLCV